jgi:hypothetical protein
MSKVVELYDSSVPVLIVEYPTGLHFTGQCGGMGTTHPQAEGFAIPLIHFAKGYGWSDVDEACHAKDGWCTYPDWDEASIKALRKAWPKPEDQLSIYGLDLDETRLAQAEEAWYPVTVKVAKYAPEQAWLNGYKGWLYTSDNCD